MTTAQSPWYLLPFVPLALTLILIWWQWPSMSEGLREEQLQRDNRRALLVNLTGFSFAGLLAVSVVDATILKNLMLPTYYLLIAFLAYFTGLSFIGYAVRRWEVQLISGSIAVGSLCLLMCVAAIVRSTHEVFGDIVTGLSLAIWVFDYGLDWCLSMRSLGMASNHERDTELATAPQTAEGND